MLNSELGDIIFGTGFVLFAVAAVILAAIRRGSGVRVLIWLALWSGVYGSRELLTSNAIVASLPPRFQVIVPDVIVVIGYLAVIFALLPWRELCRGGLRRVAHVLIAAESVIAVGGVIWYAQTGSTDTFMLLSNLVADCALCTLTAVVLVRPLSQKYLTLPNRRVLVVGTLVFALEALYSNLGRVFVYDTSRLLDSAGFAALLVALAIVAAEIIFAAERRLMAVQNELAIARQIQATIVPGTLPAFDKLRVAAAYYPATEVAGDFYDVVKIDNHRAGFLVADVSGHGVPAALIASMIKIAFESVAAAAHDPGEMLRRLGLILGNQLRGQFVSAAYLYVDTAVRLARYSAAGHPPLIFWDSGTGNMRSVESNGLLFGVSKDAEYPNCEFAMNPGDQFLLYTDGVTEAENREGEFFGDARLGELIRADAGLPIDERSNRLWRELQDWQQLPAQQQDDMTWIMIELC
jgi:sigma-B regulation protein RsbU (phosphoserine phosphatase)